MPSYDFKCKECGYKFSVTTSISEKNNVKCPECGGRKVVQLFTGFNCAVRTRGEGSNGCLPASGSFGGG